MSDAHRDFVPALGKSGSLDRYDAAIALMTREKRWRSDLLRFAEPRPGERIVDIGCGTGTFAIALKQAAPESIVLAVDPDPAVLEIARAKAEVADAEIRWFEAMGDELDGIAALRQCDKIVSSLVLHQCPMAVKEAIAAQMFRLLRPGGTLFIADYGEQRSLLMRMLFRQIQLLDGFEYTEPNAKGCVPEILTAAGFEAVEEMKVIPTPTGSISIYGAKR
ncbi:MULTISPECIES: class I SAM-dependent methyltransferase [Sphingopyxis]|jgi:ubiquinone/menaquinone biosynthesis C-methylase UbiE|uniref:Methyltransferase type 11 n=1 Tax=Sphingopyxis macrogoltabida TaxID=33050 RepID=A0A0N9U2R0_SPHMC|nr:MULTISPECIES: class I SAM-dependent methyltransferase [Sphingopyxis]ALH79250.1 methyltransferase type 11 [Sphingopyxis macrogoltabida]